MLIILLMVHELCTIWKAAAVADCVRFNHELFKGLLFILVWSLADLKKSRGEKTKKELKKFKVSKIILLMPVTEKIDWSLVL